MARGAAQARKRAIVKQAAVRRQQREIPSLPSAATDDDVERYVKTVDWMLGVRNKIIARPAVARLLTREDKLALGWPPSSVYPDPDVVGQMFEMDVPG